MDNIDVEANEILWLVEIEESCLFLIQLAKSTNLILDATWSVLQDESFDILDTFLRYLEVPETDQILCTEMNMDENSPGSRDPHDFFAGLSDEPTKLTLLYSFMIEKCILLCKKYEFMDRFWRTINEFPKIQNFFVSRFRPT